MVKHPGALAARPERLSGDGEGGGWQSHFESTQAHHIEETVGTILIGNNLTERQKTEATVPPIKK
jgi:hypothetical protein